MSLDIYLYLKKYESVSRYDKDGDAKAKGFYPKELRKFAERQFKGDDLSKETKFRIGHWWGDREINQWVTDNVGEEVENCKEIEMSVEEVERLLKFVEEEDYGDYTINLLKDTLAFMKKHEKENWYVTYMPSW